MATIAPVRPMVETPVAPATPTPETHSVTTPTLQDIQEFLSASPDSYLNLDGVGDCLGACLMRQLNPEADVVIHYWDYGTLYYEGENFMRRYSFDGPVGAYFMDLERYNHTLYPKRGDHMARYSDLLDMLQPYLR